MLPAKLVYGNTIMGRCHRHPLHSLINGSCPVCSRSKNIDVTLSGDDVSEYCSAGPAAGVQTGTFISNKPIDVNSTFIINTCGKQVLCEAVSVVERVIIKYCVRYVGCEVVDRAVCPYCNGRFIQYGRPTYLSINGLSDCLFCDGLGFMPIEKPEVDEDIPTL